MKVLVTGGAGFIGSNLIRHLINDLGAHVINVDKLTYAGNLDSLSDVFDSPNHTFEHIDICNVEQVERVFAQHTPDKLMHLAAESHVDRSIDGPSEFVRTNLLGTYTLLEAARKYWIGLEKTKRDNFRFHHISTDEVYGELNSTEDSFTEETPYNPSSPYSATKAGADHLVRAWGRTFGLPLLITNCSNNYGPRQFPEKLIPLVILNAIQCKQIPVYGKGLNVRDWIYVEDHVSALLTVLQEGEPGKTFNIGANMEKTNIDVVRTICSVLDELQPKRLNKHEKYEELITYVEDRPGHDFRYAIDSSRIEGELGWKPTTAFEEGIYKTVQWYLANRDWWGSILDRSYRDNNLKTGKSII